MGSVVGEAEVVGVQRGSLRPHALPVDQPDLGAIRQDRPADPRRRTVDLDVRFIDTCSATSQVGAEGGGQGRGDDVPRHDCVGDLAGQSRAAGTGQVESAVDDRAVEPGLELLPVAQVGRCLTAVDDDGQVASPWSVPPANTPALSSGAEEELADVDGLEDVARSASGAEVEESGPGADEDPARPTP